MASTARTRRRLGVLIVGAVALTALSAAIAEAATPAPMAGRTVGLMGLDAGDPGSGLGGGLRARTGAPAGPRLAGMGGPRWWRAWRDGGPVYPPVSRRWAGASSMPLSRRIESARTVV
jgi:hypothetical protein